MPLLTTIAAALQPWADEYSTSPVVSTAVTFAHLGGLLVGGGFALATDRMTLQCCRAEDDAKVRTGLLSQISATHRPVAYALIVVFVSGLLMLGADVKSLIAAPRFWVKMGLVLLLLVNGLAMTRVEKKLRRNPDAANSGWRRLHGYSIASFGLWLTITLAGVWLTNG